MALALQLADQPAAKQVLTNVDQLAFSVQVFTKTAERDGFILKEMQLKLPKKLTNQL